MLLSAMILSSVAVTASFTGGRAHVCWADVDGIKCFRPAAGAAADPAIGNATCAAGGATAECRSSLAAVAPATVRGPYPAGLAAGGDNTCAWTQTGGVYCWGANERINTEIPPDLGDVRAVSVSAKRACALTQRGIRCWGEERSCLPNSPLWIGDLLRDAAADTRLSLHAGDESICLHSYTPGGRGDFACGVCYQHPDGIDVGRWAARERSDFFDRSLLFAGNRKEICAVVAGMNSFPRETSSVSVACDQYDSGDNWQYLGPTLANWSATPWYLGTDATVVYVADEGGVRWARRKDLWTWDRDRRSVELQRIDGMDGLEALATVDGAICGHDGAAMRCAFYADAEHPQFAVRSQGLPPYTALRFEAASLGRTLDRLAEIVYARKAAVLTAAARELERAPPDATTFAFAMRIVEPLLESVTTPHFEAQVLPVLRQRLASLRRLSELPRSPATDRLGLQVLRAAVASLREDAADAAARDRLDAIVAACGRALASSTAAVDVTPVAAALDAAADTLAAMTSGRGEGEALVALLLKEYW